MTLDRKRGEFEGDAIIIECLGEEKLATVESPEGEVRVTIPVESDFEERRFGLPDVNYRETHVFDPECSEVVTRGPDV